MFAVVSADKMSAARCFAEISISKNCGAELLKDSAPPF